MASGVAVSDGVIKVFHDMKVRKASTPAEVKERKKAVLFGLSEDKKSIVLAGEVGVAIDDPYLHFVKMLPDRDCHLRDQGEQNGGPRLHLLGAGMCPPQE